MKKKYPLVLVEWIDAQSDCEWGSIEKTKKWADEECLINDIGWLVCTGKKYIVITNQVGEDGELGNRTKIPKSWIKKKEYVSLKKSHEKK